MNGLYRSRSGVLLGVLKGIADHFGLPVFWLRVGAVFGLFFSGFFPMIALYVAMALTMKREPGLSCGAQNSVRGRPRRFYRSRDGILMGVAGGIADYFDFSQPWLRLFLFVGAVFTGVVPALVLYGLAAFAMPKEPVVRLDSMAEQEFYDSYAHSRQGAVHRVKRRYDRLEKRLRRMEGIVTDREFDWKRRFSAQRGL